MTKSTWGGQRKGSGRKPKKDKKVLLTITIEPDLLAQLHTKHTAGSFSEFIARILKDGII